MAIERMNTGYPVLYKRAGSFVGEGGACRSGSVGLCGLNGWGFIKFAEWRS